MTMPSVLFVCYANQFRSPAAAVLLRARLKQAGLEGDWNVQSAGTWPQAGATLPPPLLRELELIGVPIRDHRSRPITGEMLAGMDLILVMEHGQAEAISSEFPEARDRVFLLSEIAEGISYDIPDPVRDPRHTFPEVTADLKQLIDKGFDEICRRLAPGDTSATAHEGPENPLEEDSRS